jgi:LuxR family transcriptional regulator, maltose regulon positive regulatory protein
MVTHPPPKNRAASTASVERFRPPAVTSHEIVRLRLLDPLTHTHESGAARITLVRGPAGFGKTTLLAQAYRQVLARGGTALWLDCSKQDADPTHLWDSLYASAALIGIDLNEPEFTPSDFAARVTHVDAATYLFLDEVERLIGTPSEAAVERVVLALPATAHVILGSRTTPHSWFLTRELHGHATTIDPRELRLTGPELQMLLQERFSTDEVQQIEQLTEGWPVAVQLTRLRSRDATALRDLITVLERGGLGLFDYLAERVVEALTPEQQLFLRDTSILPFINTRSVNAIMQRDDGYSLLAGVMHLQPIITVTGDPELTIRLHPLFRQFMQDQLARVGRAHEHELQRRAAHFFFSRGRTQEAIYHALEADDPPLALRLFDEAGGEQLIFTMGPRRIRVLLASMPDSSRELSLRWRLTELLIAAVDGRAVHTRELFSRLWDKLNALPASTSIPGIEPSMLPKWMKFARETGTVVSGYLLDLYDGCPAGLIALAANVTADTKRQLLISECYPGFSLAFETLILARYGVLQSAHRTLADYGALCVRNHFAQNLPSINPQRSMLAFLAGDFDAAPTFMRHSDDRRLDRFEEPEELLTQLTKTLLAVLQYERGELTESAETLASVRIDPEWSLPEILALSTRTRVLLAEHGGDRMETGLLIDQACNEARQQDARRYALFLTALRLELRARRGEHFTDDDADLVSTFDMLSRELTLSEPCWFFVDQGARGLIPALILRDRATEGLPLCEQMLTLARAQGRRQLEAIAHILIARSRWALDQMEEAANHLRAALVITGTNRSVQPYIDLAADLGKLLVRLSTERGSPALATHRRNVLRALEARAGLEPTGWSTLSERERDILSALAAHSTTKEVARTLGLSPETVKHHLKRIFTKLGVHSREEALERIARGPG